MSVKDGGFLSFDWRKNYLLRNVGGGLTLILTERITKFAFLTFLALLLLAIFGPMVTPYEYNEQQYDPESGELLRSQPPSGDYLLGTTEMGFDVFSRVIYGARPTMITGLLGGAMIIGIGMVIGITAGYVGGWADSVLMRGTDLVYGVPVLPFAIVILAFFGMGFWTSILVIGAILWRGNARVLRSQVLQIKERPYIKAARATGAGPTRIIVRHIMPNLGSMMVLFFALGAGFTILLQAGLSFLGVTNPFVPSWGVMLRNVYDQGLIAQAWWWSIPPGALISATVLSVFLLGRGYEQVSESAGEG